MNSQTTPSSIGNVMPYWPKRCVSLWPVTAHVRLKIKARKQNKTEAGAPGLNTVRETDLAELAGRPLNKQTSSSNRQLWGNQNPKQLKHLEATREREKDSSYKGTTIKLIAVVLVRNDGGQKAVGWCMKIDKRKKSCQPEILCLINYLQNKGGIKWSLR